MHQQNIYHHWTIQSDKVSRNLFVIYCTYFWSIIICIFMWLLLSHKKYDKFFFCIERKTSLFTIMIDCAIKNWKLSLIFFHQRSAFFKRKRIFNSWLKSILQIDPSYILYKNTKNLKKKLGRVIFFKLFC
jgi:hypothetical protein